MIAWKRWRRHRRVTRSVETITGFVLEDIADQGSFYTLSLVNSAGEWFWLNLRKDIEIESILAAKKRKRASR